MHPAQLGRSPKRTARAQAPAAPAAAGLEARDAALVRGATGWFLVNLGLRLAVWRPAVPAATR